MKFNQTGTKFFFLACANLARELLLPHTSQNVILDEIQSLKKQSKLMSDWSLRGTVEFVLTFSWLG